MFHSSSANEPLNYKRGEKTIPTSHRRAEKQQKELSHVHTDFLTTLAEEAAESAEDFTDSDYALGEFIDRYGPRSGSL